MSLKCVCASVFKSETWSSHNLWWASCLVMCLEQQNHPPLIKPNKTRVSRVPIQPGFHSKLELFYSFFLSLFPLARPDVLKMPKGKDTSTNYSTTARGAPVRTQGLRPTFRTIVLFVPAQVLCSTGFPAWIWEIGSKVHHHHHRLKALPLTARTKFIVVEVKVMAAAVAAAPSPRKTRFFSLQKQTDFFQQPLSFVQSFVPVCLAIASLCESVAATIYNTSLCVLFVNNFIGSHSFFGRSTLRVGALLF